MSPAKDITEEREQNGVHPPVGEDNTENIAIENGVSPVPGKEGGQHETEAVSPEVDSAVKEEVSQKGDKTVERGGEVMVDGEGGDIDTSEC